MAEPDRVIEYATHTNDIHALRLEQNADAFRVIFPVKPTWMWVLDIVAPLFFACCKLVTAIWILLMVWRVSSMRVFGPPTALHELILRFGLEIFGATGLAVAFWTVIAAFDWWRFRKFAGEPRELIVNREGITDRKPGWLQMCERRVGAGDIKEIRLKVYRFHFSRKKTVADLVIYRVKGWPIRCRLSTADGELPGEIGRRMAMMVGCSLK